MANHRDELNQLFLLVNNDHEYFFPPRQLWLDSLRSLANHSPLTLASDS